MCFIGASESIAVDPTPFQCEFMMPSNLASKPANFRKYHIRKWHMQIEEIHSNECGEPADGAALRKIVVAAVIANPYAGRFSQDLNEIIDDSPSLGEEFARRIHQLLNGEQGESYGKACVVGINGEYEHGNAFLTSIFADPIRKMLGGGLSWVPSTGKRGTPGTSIDIPLAHKDELYVRSHYDTMTVQFSDAPNPDEVVIAVVVANRGRLHARLGGVDSEQVAKRIK